MKQANNQLFLENITIQGYKSIHKLKFTLNRGLNMMIGKSGSGKSNLFEALNDALSVQGLRQADFKSAKLQFETDSGIKLKMVLDQLPRNPDLDFLDERIEYSERNVRTAIRIYRKGEIIYDNIKNTLPIPLHKKLISRSLSGLLRKLSYTPLPLKHLPFPIPKTLEGIDLAGTITATIDPDGHVSWSKLNTLWVVERAYLDLESSTGYQEDNLKTLDSETILKSLVIPLDVKENLKRYSPIADVRYRENISVYHHEKGMTIENVKLEFMIDKTWLPWSYLPEWTKRLFYIIAEVITHPKSLILVELSELEVHPDQFSQIMEFILETAVSRQVIISIQSPMALNYLKPDELDQILIAKYNPEKGTQIRHLRPFLVKRGKIHMETIGKLSDFWILSDL